MDFSEKKDNKNTNVKVIKEKLSAVDMSNALKMGSEIAAVGATYAKSGAISAKNGIKTAAGVVAQKGQDSQKAVLKYVEEKKNKRFLEAKLQAFEDGVKQGKIETVDYVKKYANFCLAATAVSFFFARCDGCISEEELLEIQFDLDSITKNRDLPEELRKKLADISQDENLTFSEVRDYLDGVSYETLLEFQRDIEEIILADGIINESEKNAKKSFDDYLKSRDVKSENE